MGNSQQFAAVIEQRRQQIQLQRAISIERNNAQLCAYAGAQHLPRNNVGMVLHLANDNVITCPHIATAPTVGYQVNTLRRTTHKHQLFG